MIMKAERYDVHVLLCADSVIVSVELAHYKLLLLL
jgi:hypothetical protein